MPDLNIEHYWACQDLDYYQEKVKNDKGTQYTVTCTRGDWHCTCPGFKFRGHCKHVEQAEKNRCTWNQYTQGGDVKYVNNDTEKIPVCPECGRPAISVPTAV